MKNDCFLNVENKLLPTKNILWQLPCPKWTNIINYLRHNHKSKTKTGENIRNTTLLKREDRQLWILLSIHNFPKEIALPEY